jgi:hypothetical protein
MQPLVLERHGLEGNLELPADEEWRHGRSSAPSYHAWPQIPEVIAGLREFRLSHR